MEKDNLNKLWEFQAIEGLNINPKELIKKANKQRNEQYISITVMSLTVIVLIAYAIFYAFSQWNTFNLGLMLMIASLSVRVMLEFYSLHRKEKQLVSMPQKSYYTYLKKYYKTRQIVNYLITPICVSVYIAGFYLLLPYFKAYFSRGFYLYIVVSGIVSIAFVMGIIIKGIIKEERYLKQLNG